MVNSNDVFREIKCIPLQTFNCFIIITVIIKNKKRKKDSQRQLVYWCFRCSEPARVRPN